MDYRALGTTGNRVSILGLGSGGRSMFGQRRGASAEEGRSLVRAALDLGVNYFDTAARYGDSELLLGDALSIASRSDFYLTTKYRPVTENGSVLSPRDVEAKLQESLRRLRVDYLDVLMIHALMPENFDAVVRTQLPALLRAKEAGLIRAIGVSESYGAHHVTLARAVDQGSFDVILIGYNVLNQSAERDVLQAALKAGVGVTVMSPVRGPLASNRTVESLISDLNQLGIPRAEALPTAALARWLDSEPARSLQSTCHRYVMAHPAVSTMLTGTFNEDHLRANVAAVESGPLSEADANWFRKLFGHLDMEI